MTEYCRLCAELKEPDEIVASIGDIGQLMEQKLRACCQWTAENTEHRLPHSVCSICLDKLEKCWLFAQSVQLAQQRLLEIFDKCLPSVIKVETEAETEMEMDIEVKPLATDLEQSACDFDYLENWNDSPSPPSIDINPAGPAPSPKEKTKHKAKAKSKTSDPIKSTKIEPPNDKPSEEYIHKCPECEKYFKKRWHLTKHIQRHSSERPFECTMCHKTFKLRTSLKDHIVIHILSPKARRENRLARLQEKLKPKERTKQSHGCLECGKSFAQRKSLKYHLDTKHSNVYRFECCLCHKIFKSQRLLKSHVRVHVHKRVRTANPAASCICELCGKTFPSVARLKSHLQTLHNSSERPFKCDVCGLGYKMKSSLRSHQVMHTEYEYKCTQCEKEFRKKVSLKKHMEYHRGPVAKPFVCEFCGKGFRFNANYAEHRRIHTGETPYECEYCSSKFRTCSCFYTHLKKAHGIAKSVLNIEQRARITAMTSIKINSDPPPEIPK